MKKQILYFLFFCFILLFSACNEEEKEATPAENISNKTWVVTSSNTEINVPFIGQLPDSIIQELDPTQNLEGQTIVFNTDGTFIVGEETENEQQGNWTLSEDGEILTFSGLVEGDLTQIIDAQTLTDLQTFEVVTLTETQLAIQNSTEVPIPAEVAEAITGFPIGVVITVKLNINFDKQ